MSNFPWLTVAGAIPLVGAIVVALTPGRSAPGSAADRRSRDLLVKRITLIFTLITLAVTVVIAVKFKAGGPRFQFQQVYQWIPQFGVHYAVGVDGIALVLIVMTAILMPVVILASWNDVESLTAAAAGCRRACRRLRAAGDRHGRPAGRRGSAARSPTSP